MGDEQEVGDGAGGEVDTSQISLENVVKEGDEEKYEDTNVSQPGDGGQNVGKEEDRQEEEKGHHVEVKVSDYMEVQKEGVDEKKEETMQPVIPETNQDEVEKAEVPVADQEIQKTQLVGREEEKAEEVHMSEASDANGVPGVEEHDVKEQVQNQDAEIQIEDIAAGTAEQPHSEDVEMVPAALTPSVEEKGNGTECLELPAGAENPVQAVGNEGIEGYTVTEDVTEADAKNGSGDKLDVINEIEYEIPNQPNLLTAQSNEHEPEVHLISGISEMERTTEKHTGPYSNDKTDENKEGAIELRGKQLHVEEEPPTHLIKEEEATDEANGQRTSGMFPDGDDSGTPEEQASFVRELEIFFKERGTDFKNPKFYGDTLNLLKLWRAVVRLGGYEQVTACKLWRQVGESFNPPKTCTTISYAFRLFYEKALLDFEKHKTQDGDIPHDDLLSGLVGETQSGSSRGPGTGRVRRDSAARAMQGWHQQRVLGNGEVGDPIIKASQEKNLNNLHRREKHTKSIDTDTGSTKRKTLSPLERPSKMIRTHSSRSQLEINVVDVGVPADWVKVNVRKTKDCFEIYALVPGLLREEVRVQSDPAGRLVITGEPEKLDNPWGVTPFKKVVSLPTRIDPHQTSAVVTLHGQLFVRVPFEPSEG